MGDGVEVFSKYGQHIGELVDEHYILRRTNEAVRAIRARRATPVTPTINLGIFSPKPRPGLVIEIVIISNARALS